MTLWSRLSAAFNLLALCALLSSSCSSHDSAAKDAAPVTDGAMRDGAVSDAADAATVPFDCAGLPRADENLALMGSFESFEESWLLPTTSATRVDLETADVHGGQIALRVTHDGETRWVAAPADSVPVDGADTLLFKAFIKSTSLTGTVQFELDELDVDETVIATHRSDGVGDAPSWTEVRLSFTAQAAARSVALRITVEPAQGNTFSGIVLYDDLSLTGSRPRELTTNGSFTDGMTGWDWHPTPSPYVLRDESVYRSPPAAVRLEPTPPFADPSLARETWNTNGRVAAGQLVVASAWGKSDPGDYPDRIAGTLLNIDLRGPEQGPQAGILGTANAALIDWGLDWTRTETANVVAPGEDRVVVALGAFPIDHAGNAWFDDASMVVDDLMPNPGWEHFRPVGWDFLGTSNEQWTSRLDALDRHCGQVALRVDYHGFRSTYDYLLESATKRLYGTTVVDRSIAVEPGATVRLSGYVKTENLSFGTGLELAQYDASGNMLGGAARREPQNPTATVAGTQDWIHLERAVSLSPDTSYVLVRIRTAIASSVGAAGPQAISGTAWYDDVTLTYEP